MNWLVKHLDVRDAARQVTVSAECWRKKKTRRWERRVRFLLLSEFTVLYAAWLPVVALELLLF